jgi:hypothetical protein
LHGELEGFDAAHRVHWRRRDVMEPIVLPMDSISAMKLASALSGAAAPHVTVKLAGGNWLAADVLGMQGGKLQLRFGGGSPVTIDRSRVEWLFFSKSAAPECYDGPTSMAGWMSAGGWTYRDGALRASSPSMIGRFFECLPDRVEYLVEVDQDPRQGDAFAIMLHGRNPVTRPQGPGAVQLMFLGSTLQMVSQIEGSTRVCRATRIPHPRARRMA